MVTINSACGKMPPKTSLVVGNEKREKSGSSKLHSYLGIQAFFSQISPAPVALLINVAQILASDVQFLGVCFLIPLFIPDLNSLASFV